MIVNVNALPESELDYWARLALIAELINEQKALNNFLTEDEAEKLFEPDTPVMVDYDDSDIVTANGEEIIDVQDNRMTLEKSFKMRLIEKFQKIGRK